MLEVLKASRLVFGLIREDAARLCRRLGLLPTHDVPIVLYVIVLIVVLWRSVLSLRCRLLECWIKRSAQRGLR
jgi:hypothetical protein